MSEPSATEASYNFWQEFKDQRQAIQQQIDNASSISQLELAQYFNSILQSINTLEKKLTEATEYIPSYDERQYSRQIKELNDALEAAKNTFMPKHKFSFRSRKKAAAAVKDQKEEAPKQATAAAPPPHKEDSNNGSVPGLLENTILFADMSDQIVRIEDRPTKGSENSMDVLLSNLNRCIVVLTGTPISALHIKNLNECLVVCGTIQGSILTYGFTRSTIAIACHQFRMHDANNLHILLHVTSHPIIEDSKGIVVGPYIDTQAEGTNYYDCMEDFNWLKKQASPNWKTMYEQDAQQLNARVKEIAQNPDLQMLEDILPPSSN